MPPTEAAYSISQEVAMRGYIISSGISFGTPLAITMKLQL